jgi:hypothetical protein
MSVFDSLVGLDHALVKLRLRDALHKPEQDRPFYLNDIVLPQYGRRIRDLVERALKEALQ